MAQETGAPDYMAGSYFEYQKRYLQKVRESDRALLAFMRQALDAGEKRGGRVLDIGCSNGNLIRHMRELAPKIEYWGGDLQSQVIERCRAEADLAGIRFEVMNVRDLSGWPTFDIIVANAVLFRFSELDFASVCGSLANALVRGGWLFTFDFYHRFRQDIAIQEYSAWHPEGLKLHFRSFDTARRIFIGQGFIDVQLYPFHIPIDLPTPGDPSDISTYTRRMEDGTRLQFRGALFQPWCHLMARKA